MLKYVYFDSDGNCYGSLSDARRALRYRLRTDPDSVKPFPFRDGLFIKRSYLKHISKRKSIEYFTYYGIKPCSSTSRR